MRSILIRCFSYDVTFVYFQCTSRQNHVAFKSSKYEVKQGNQILKQVGFLILSDTSFCNPPSTDCSRHSRVGKLERLKCFLCVVMVTYSRSARSCYAKTIHIGIVAGSIEKSACTVVSEWSPVCRRLKQRFEKGLLFMTTVQLFRRFHENFSSRVVIRVTFFNLFSLKSFFKFK